jgi:ubiquinone/menaquinone biosynthesis C-methylase UbiE
MWPRGPAAQQRVRTMIRAREARLILHVLTPLLRHRRPTADALRVLEIGSGAGDQAPHWLELGSLIATDLTHSRKLRLPQRGASFLLCDATYLPFRPESFDVIVANHVLEHITDLKTGLSELQRIGSDQSLYAFSLPTPIWLVLSLPTQYLWKLFNLFARVNRWVRVKGRQEEEPSTTEEYSSDVAPEIVQIGFLAKLKPYGHGVYSRFGAALRAFRPAQWRDVFIEAGYELVAEDRLLLYATARWPLVPCCRWPTRLGLHSSHLYVVRTSQKISPSPGYAIDRKWSRFHP